MNCRLVRSTLLLALPLALLLAAGGVGHADDDGDEDHDAARRAREAGEVLPLAALRDRVAARVGGRVVGVEFERHGGRYLYEFKLIMPDGRLLEAEVDARTGDVLKNEADD
jgi:uncharacterized membrane protein YkoI